MRPVHIDLPKSGALVARIDSREKKMDVNAPRKGSAEITVIVPCIIIGCKSAGKIMSAEIKEKRDDTFPELSKIPTLRLEPLFQKLRSRVTSFNPPRIDPEKPGQFCRRYVATYFRPALICNYIDGVGLGGAIDQSFETDPETEWSVHETVGLFLIQIISV